MNQIPENVFFDLAREWLTIKDLIDYDTTNTNKKLKNKIYALKSFKLDEEIELNVNNVKWFLKNNIKLTNVKIKNLDDSIIEYLITHGDNIKRFNLYDHHIISNEHINIIVNTCPKIKHFVIDKYLDITAIESLINSNDLLSLDISNSRIINSGNFVCIKKLNLVEFKMNNCSLSYLFIEEILKNSPELLNIEMSLSKTLRDITILNISSYCHSLMNLNISGCEKITDESFLNFTGCPLLKTLDISYSHLIRCTFLDSLTINCPLLTYLNISNMLKSLKGKLNLPFKNLTELNISNSKIDHSFNLHIGMNFPQLTKINAFADYGGSKIGLIDKSLIDFLKNSPYLKSLDLTNNGCLTDKSFSCINGNYDELILTHCRVTNLNFISCNKLKISFCYQLVSLNVISCKEILVDFCMMLIDISPIKNLERIKIKGCELLSESLIISIIEANDFLTYINLAYTKITDLTLFSIAKKCSNLERLNLGRCTEIHDSYVIEISKNCRKLTSINFSKTKLTDLSIIAITENCPNLNEIILDDCTEITDISIIAISKNCSKMKGLFIKNCPGVSEIYKEMFKV